MNRRRLTTLLRLSLIPCAALWLLAIIGMNSEPWIWRMTSGSGVNYFISLNPLGFQFAKQNASPARSGPYSSDTSKLNRMELLDSTGTTIRTAPVYAWGLPWMGMAIHRLNHKVSPTPPTLGPAGQLVFTNAFVFEYTSAAIAHWLIATITGLWLIFLLTIRWGFRKYLQPHQSLCPTCGYDLRATPQRCPECRAIPGRLSIPRQNKHPPRRVNGGAEKKSDASL